MKNIPTVTLQEIADFVLSLPDDTPIDNACGSNKCETGCIMTQFARSKGWDFGYSYNFNGTWAKGDEVVADIPGIDGVLQSLFIKWFSGSIRTAVYYKNQLKPEFLNK